MDGQTIVTIFATLVLVFAMWYTNKLTNKTKHSK